jgi:16S rRNA (cytosine967-C5)-methyltransferase
MQLSSLVGHTQELLGIVLTSKKPADNLIDIYFRSHRYLGSHDRRFIAETIYGILRHFRRCDFIIDAMLLNGKNSLLEEDCTLLLIITYLINLSNQKGLTSSVVSTHIKSNYLKDNLSHILTRLEQSFELACESNIQSIGLKYSFPDWIVERLIEQYGENEAEQICESLNGHPPLTLRINTLKTDLAQCRSELLKNGIDIESTSYSPFGLHLKKRINIFSLSEFRKGWFEVQDEGSQLIPLLIDPKPTDKVLDVCSGAGGKALEFSSIMKNRGEVYATDINEFRLEELRKRMRRSGAQNIRINHIQSVQELEAKFKSYFDVVVVDAPCSGLGTIRRNPGMKWTVTEQTIRELSEKQKTILNEASILVKDGGRLVYATCTILKEENEEVVECFLQTHQEFQITKPSEQINRLNINSASTQKYIKMLPHVLGTDGFFFAVMEKR